MPSLWSGACEAGMSSCVTDSLLRIKKNKKGVHPSAGKPAGMDAFVQNLCSCGTACRIDPVKLPHLRYRNPAVMAAALVGG